MKKRLIAGFLALFMVFQGIPQMAAYAEDSTGTSVTEEVLSTEDTTLDSTDTTVTVEENNGTTVSEETTETTTESTEENTENTTEAVTESTETESTEEEITFSISALGSSNTTTGTELDLSISSLFTFSYNSFYYTVNDTKVSFALTDNVYTMDTDNYSVLNITEIGGEIAFTIADPHTDLSEGDYFTYTFPTVLSLKDVSDTAILDETVGATIATYSIQDNVLTVTLGDAVSTDGIYAIEAAIAFTATLNTDEIGTEDANSYEVLPATANNSAYTLELPKVPTEISGLTKEASEVQVDATTGNQYVDWTITVGSDASSSGLSLEGMAVTDTITSGELTFAGAYLGSSYGTGTQILEEDSENTSFSYTFESGATAPATIVVRTYLTETLSETAYSNAYDSDSTNDVTTTTNTVTLDAGTSSLSLAADSTEASASVVVPYATVSKQGTQISGNSMDWTITVNSDHVEFYKAIVSDILSLGLTVDETAGVRIEGDDGTSITLDGDNTSDSSTGISYTLETDASTGQQTLYIYFGDDSHYGYSAEYTISFTTDIAVDYSTSEDTSLDSTVSNAAYIQALYPSGSGTGTGKVWGIPAVSTNFSAVYISKESTEASTTTGLITWAVYPGTRIEDYGTAVITDTITLDDQELSGTPTVAYEDGTELSSGGYSYTYDETTGELVFTFDESVLTSDGKTLDDVVIIYQTKALTYFQSNENHTYSDSVELSITYSSKEYTATASATAELQNNLLDKSIEVVNDTENNVSYYHFTIPINANGMTLADVSVSDDLSSIFYTDLNDASTVLSTDLFTIASAGTASDYAYKTYVTDQDGNFDTDATVTVDDDAKTVTASWTSDITEEKILHIYVSFDASALTPDGTLSETTIYANNTAVLASSTLLTTDQTLSVTTASDDTNSFVNEVLDKSGTFVSDDDSITWNITVNANHADISGYLTYTDTISKGLAFDSTTFQVTTDDGEDVTASASVTSEPQLDGTTVLTITLPSGTTTESYVISYATAITTSDSTTRLNNLSNTVVLGTETTVDTTKTAVVQASAKSSGSAKARVTLTFTKVDAASTSDNPIYVAGALYGVYSDASCETLIYSAYTDENGEVSLIAPWSTTSNTYYVKEISAKYATSSVSATQGYYTADETIYGAYTYTTPGTKAIVPYKDGYSFTDNRANYFVDSRTTSVVGDVTITKSYTLADITASVVKNGVTVEGLQSTFTLYLYPSGVEGSSKTAVTLYETTTEGTYTYDEENASSTTAATVQNLASGADGTGTFTITDLPFGLYGIVETVAADGYVLDSTVHYFTVSYGTDTTVTTATVSAGSDFDETYTIANTSTDAIVTLQNSDGATVTSESQYVLSGDLILDGTDTSATDTLTLSGSDLADGVELLGVLKTGQTYSITAESVQAGYITPGTTTFTVNTDGSITLKSAGNGSVSGTTLTITQKPTTFTFTLQDSNGVTVTDAVITVTDSTGTEVATWTTDGTSVTLTGILVAGETYTITETSPDTVVSTEDATLTLTVSEDGASATVTNSEDTLTATVASKTTVTMVNQRVLANLSITKLDALTGEAVPAVSTDSLTDYAAFEIHQYTGSIDDPTTDVTIATIQTNSDGVALTTECASTVTNSTYSNKALALGLTVGTYYIVEVTAPTAYELNEEKVTFEVTNSDQGNTISLSVSDERKTGTMNLTVTTDGTASLDGAEFGVYTYNETTGEYEEVLDADGNARTVTVTEDTTASVTTATGTISDLTWGVDYYLKALNVPSGYRFDENMHGAYTITATSVNATVEVELSEIVTSITFLKQGQKSTGATESALEGVSFTVSGIFAGDSETTTKTFTTGEDGTFTITNQIVAGNTYTVTEGTAPSTTVDGETYTYAVIDSFTFAVDAYGKVTSLGAAEEGTTMNENQLTWESSDGEITKIIMTDWMTGFYIETVGDTTDTAVTGSELVITSADGTETYRTVTVTSEDGKVFVEGLVPGTYMVSETTVPTGYNRAYSVTFTLNEDNTVEITSTDGTAADYSTTGTAYSISTENVAVIVMDHETNQLSFTTSVRIYNGNEDGSVGNYDGTTALAGVTYGVYSDSTCETPVTDADGNAITLTSESASSSAVASVASLELGITYYLKAISVPDMDTATVVLDDTVYSATVDGSTFAGLTNTETNEVVTDVVFEVYRSTISFTKIEEDSITEENPEGKALQGSVYGLYQLDSNIIDNSTDADTSLLSAIKEKAATVVQFFATLLFGSPVSVNAEETTDTTESDTSAIEVNGDTYTLVATATTDADGVLTFTNVVAGQTYMIKELSAPEGYAISSEVVAVTLTYDASTDSYTTDMGESDVWTYDAATNKYYWNEPVVQVEIFLTDESDNYLDGGVMELLDEEGEVVMTSTGDATWTTSSEDGESFNGILTIGSTYTVHQLSAPSGYQKSDVTFTVETSTRSNGDNYVQNVVVVDPQVVTTTDGTILTDTVVATSSGSDDTTTTSSSGNPSTGDPFTFIPAVGLLTAGVVLFAVGAKKKRKEE